MSKPRYLVWNGNVPATQPPFTVCGSLPDALTRAGQHGGTIYEPLGIGTAEYIDREDRLLKACEAMVAALAPADRKYREEAIQQAWVRMNGVIAEVKQRHAEFARLAEETDKETP